MITALTLGIPGVAVAQADEPASPDIIVTAQRRSENLTDVPMSIVALSSQSLAQAGVTSTSELAKVAPGVTMTFFGSFLQPSIRGITSTGANLGENSNVAMYIDGVYQPQQIATLIDLPDVQQIEILKGPQGALYGQNATGGAILVSSMAPSFDLTGKLSASYGNFNDVQLRGYVSGPLSQTVAASLSGSFQRRDGFRRHVVTGARDKGLDAQVVRGKILFEPAHGQRITVSGYYSERSDSAMYAGFAIANNSIGYGADLSALGVPLPVPTSPRVTNPGQFSTSPDVFTAIQSYGGNIRGEFDLGAGTLTSTTSYFHNAINYIADVDGTAVNIGESRASPLTGKFVVHDTNFVSKALGPIQFLAGVFYLDGNETFGENIFDLQFPNVPPAAKMSLFVSNQYARVEKKIIAGYGEITLKPIDQLTLTAGGRYTREQQRTFSNLLNGVPQASNVGYPRDPVTFSKFTPRVTARYALTPDANVYASWSQGFKSGVVNTTDFTLDPVKPETITAYEIGAKGKVADGLRVNVAAFFYDYTNLQAVVFVPGRAYITQNAASARVKGIDVDLRWQATPAFALTAGAAFLDAKYRDFRNAAAFLPTGTGNLQITTDLSGKPLLRAPQFSGNVSANYNMDIAAGRLGAFASAYHTSSYGMEPSNRLRQNGYTTFDAELSFAPTGMNGLRLAIWGKNLGDAAYLGSTLASTLADVGSYAPPRTFGVRAEYAF
ncbi:TonB-dependent receptor [Sphingomonas psychrolutea]|nr:TonB-dependent receptor [Sphingomonas psychrolutea]